MADETIDDPVYEDEAADTAPAHRSRMRWPKRIGKWVLGAVLALVAILVVGLLVLNSPIGKRFVADQIASVAPASGLRFEVGRIDGSLYGEATLHDVTVYDPKGRFLEIPRIDLDWKPLSWFTSGLDVRELIVHRGRLYRAPDLLPGDPDAPILPDFDIRVDRLEIRGLTVAGDMLGGDIDRRLNFLASADIRDGRALVSARGDLDGKDRVALVWDSEPDADTFDIGMRLDAPADGVLAALTGMEEAYTARIFGDGTWSVWNGGLYATREGERFASIKLGAREGVYTGLGNIYAPGMFEGIVGRALGGKTAIGFSGTLEDSILEGKAAIRGAGLAGTGAGTIDLADKAVEDFNIDATLRNPRLLGDAFVLEGARAQAVLDGSFRDLEIRHRVTVADADLGGTRFANLVQSGTATYDGSRWTVPLDASVARIVTNTDAIDPRLQNGTVRGTLVYTGREIRSDNLAVRFPGLTADVAVMGDLETGAYGVAGNASAQNFALQNLGAIDGSGTFRFAIANGRPWTLSANADARMTRIDNSTLADLTGGNLRFSGQVALGANQPIRFNDARIRSNKLTATLGGQVADGRTSIAGRGRHTEYGPFTVEATLADDGPRAVLVFADPYPAAGLANVRVDLEPIPDGFRIATEGQSLLGPFDGVVNFYSGGNATRLVIEQLDIYNTSVTGDVTLVDSGVRGNLALAGGGLDGTIFLEARNGGQAFAVDLTASNARFAGATPIAIRQGQINATGFIGQGSSTITGDVALQGLQYGSLSVSRMVANAEVVNGVGSFNGAVAGRRGSRFSLQFNGQASTERIAVATRGSFAGRDISMPRRAVLIKADDGAWDLQRTQVKFAGGIVMASGRFGGSQGTALDLALADMPLSLIDITGADLGLGGRISGEVTYAAAPGGAPTGDAKVMIEGLSRSGLVLSSQPIDLAMVARLTPTKLDSRMVIEEGGQRRGRLQARISNLGGGDDLVGRLQRGNLFAQLRYRGPAESLWRLAALEAFDVTGQLSVAADITGSLAKPDIVGSAGGDNLRLRSGLTGTDVRNMSVRGQFRDSRLRLTRFAGDAGPGRVTGSGSVDLANLGAGRGPTIDLRIAANNAELVDRQGLGATVTGPLRIVSNGVGGTIAGRVRVNEAAWSLGGSEAVQRLPNIQVVEVNRPANRGEALARSTPWRFLIDATAPSGIDVDGLGLDSEWRGDIVLRGTTDDPRIGGQVEVVRGDYTFAGTRFDLTQGRIYFDENSPIDPRIDIEAEAALSGISVVVDIGGRAQQPEIAFRSTPPLPEEELLARILFGGSISDLSATDALQLGAALSSLRGGGGGLDPINKLRTSIGLDRLRIVSADPALDRGTAVALGKRFGSRIYVEIITDGQGYTATELEFQVTRWLALLATVSTIGRESVAAEYRRDY